MLNLSDPHGFRRRVAGLCMVLAPLFVLASALVSPSLSTDEATQLRTVAGNMDAWYAASLLGLVSIVLAIPAILGFMHMLREREVALGHVGGGLAMLGALAIVGNTAIMMVVWQMAASNSPEMTGLFTRIMDSAGVFVPFFVGTFGLGLGFVALAAGLWRAHVVAPWMAGCLAVGAVLLTVGFPAASLTLATIGAVLLAIGAGSIGRMVLSETDAEWEHTPEFSGLKPLAH